MDNLLEKWRPVVFKDKAYPAYEVSNLGRVRRQATGAILGSTSQRYPSVTLKHDRKSYTVYIHLLVAAAFIGPKPEGTHVCWHDGNRKNIAANNLYYGTGGSLAARSVQRDLGQNTEGNAPRDFYHSPIGVGGCYVGGSSAFAPWPTAMTSPRSTIAPPRLRLVTFEEDGSFSRTPLLRGDEESTERDRHIQCTLETVGGGKGLLMTRDMLEHLGITDTVEVSFEKGRILVTAPTGTVPRESKLRFAHAKS